MPVLPRLSALVPCAFALAFATPVHAEDQAELWLNGIVFVPLGEQNQLIVDTSLRMNEDAKGLSAYVLRGTLLTHVAEHVRLGGGYGQFWNYSDGDFTIAENRPHQDAWIDFPLKAGGAITSRTRLEERLFSSGSNDVGVRLRQMVQYVGPELGNTKLKPVLSEEIFYKVNSNDRQTSGFDQAWTTAGLRYPVTDRFNLDVNYFNQWVFRPGDDKMNHTALVVAGYHF